MQELLHSQGLANSDDFMGLSWSSRRGPQGPSQIEETSCAEAHRPHGLEGPQGVGVDGQDAGSAGLSLLTVLSH